MADFEDLRMADLINKFRITVLEISGSGSLGKFREASKQLQNAYDFYITAKNSFSEQEELFKNLFSAFNYAAVLVNDALKRGALTAEDKVMIGECIEILLACTEKLINSLQSRDEP